jgi:hypothetical protein
LNNGQEKSNLRSEPLLIAGTNSETGDEASNGEEYFEEEQQQQPASAEVEPLATSGGLPTWGPPHGRNTNIHPFVGPAKDVKKGRLHV